MIMVQSIVLVCHKLADKAGTTIQAIKLAELLAEQGNNVYLIGEGRTKVAKVTILDVKPSSIPFIFAQRVHNKIKKSPIQSIDIIQAFDPLYTGTAVLTIPADKKILRIGAVYDDFYPTRLINKFKLNTNSKLYHLFKKQFRTYLRLMFSQFDLIYANCHYLANKYQKISSTKIRVIPNIMKQHSIVTNSEDNMKLKLLFVGRIEPRKNVEDILLAINDPRIKKNIQRLTIVGSTKKTPEYASKVLELGKKILGDKFHHPGFVEPEILPQFYQSHTLAIFPTNDKYFPITEGMPNVVVEALSHALPIIATNVAGVPEIMGSKLSHLIISKDNVVKEIQEKIIDVLHMTPKEYNHLKQLCISAVSKFSEQHILSQYMELILE